MEFAADIVAAASRRRALNVGTTRITADQMRLLGAAMHRQFEVDAIALLRRSHPVTTFAPGETECPGSAPQLLAGYCQRTPAKPAVASTAPSLYVIE